MHIQLYRFWLVLQRKRLKNMQQQNMQIEK